MLASYRGNTHTHSFCLSFFLACHSTPGSARGSRFKDLCVCLYRSINIFDTMNSCPPPPPTSTFTVVSAMMGGGQLPDRPHESASRLQRMTSHDSQSSTCSLPSTIVPPSTPVRESSLRLKNPDQTTNRPKDDPFKIVSSALTLSLDDLSELKDENHVDLSADQFSPILGEHDHLFSPEELAKVT